ncbi:MAG: twin-arginine translocase subunit TatC [Candidatus Omnitrophica bacterium CG_4_9_14_0_2_um_filter_42_8]|nr:MAG: twin-arginine translocase subunit TatC [Candidatus Omnitrophica bacterium CG22_combo_CG10-13_8_21_14_all_43_16]PJC48695.1 MAG: twin-arginine translocase subunit TatC [Candidatus Omnitrophica bacterium CG_4_9_14_0_2_um_filter_42_8]
MADDIYPSRMSIIEHLEELRKRIIASLVFFTLASVFSFMFADKISDILRLPALGIIENFIFLAPTEVFTAYLRMSILAGFVISLPFILLQLGLFLIPAVERDQKEAIASWLVISFLLSALGIMFSYFLALPFALKFLISFAEGAAVPMISIGKYFSFAGALLLIGAGIFQIPVIMALLSYIRILNPAFFRKNRKYAVVVIFIIAAIITPTQDIVNMLIFAVPMLALYEAGILASWIIERKGKA